LEYISVSFNALNMKTHYSFIILFLSFISLGFAQNSYHLDINNIDAEIRPSSVLFTPDSNYVPGFLCPKSENASTIYASALWMGGIDANGVLHLAADKFGAEQEYSLGPVPIDSATSFAQYDVVFPITKMEVDSFLLYHQCLSDPSCNSSVSFPSYTLPNHIVNWPAHGDLSVGQDYLLAPFVDVNNDGTYDPTLGDYPCFKGDEAVFFVLNDSTLTHASGGAKIGAEIQVLAYSFYADTTSALYSTLFVNYTVINKSILDYVDFKMGIYSDFDIGYAQSDYVGTYIDENTVFGYNATPNDVGGANAVGTLIPAQSVTFLNHNLSNSMYFTTFNGSFGHDPINASQYYNYMSSIWLDNTPLTYGGTGHGGSLSTDYMFPEVTPVGSPIWTEMSAGNSVSDRRAVGNISFPTFNSGDTIVMDIAYVWARTAPDTLTNGVTKLQLEVQEVQQFYDSLITSCHNSDVVSVLEQDGQISYEVFPNPVSDQVSFYLEIPTSSIIHIYNTSGALVKYIESNLQKIELDLSALTAGLYLYTVQTENGIASGKIIKD
jgi:hypothetical protein